MPPCRRLACGMDKSEKRTSRGRCPPSAYVLAVRSAPTRPAATASAWSPTGPSASDLRSPGLAALKQKSRSRAASCATRPVFRENGGLRLVRRCTQLAVTDLHLRRVFLRESESPAIAGCLDLNICIRALCSSRRSDPAVGMALSGRRPMPPSSPGRRVVLESRLRFRAVTCISDEAGQALASRVPARYWCSSPPAGHCASRSRATPWCCGAQAGKRPA
jgi:hypothetical protein